jgi:hypothetical protein
MCLAEATSCTGFAPYLATAKYTFGPGDGVRTLRVWYRDASGTTSAPVSASIILDTIAPTGGTLGATAAVGRIALSWSPAADAGSGVAGYTLVGALGTAPPAAGCAAGTPLYTGSALSFVHAVTARATWSYRLCAVDVAGNVSAGTTKTATATAN